MLGRSGPAYARSAGPPQGLGPRPGPARPGPPPGPDAGPAPPAGALDQSFLSHAEAAPSHAEAEVFAGRPSEPCRGCPARGIRWPAPCGLGARTL